MHVLQSRVLLRPGDFDASVRFYEGVVGLVRYREWGVPPFRGVVYFLGGGYLELSESGDPQPPRGFRLWLQVPDLAAAEQHLRERGATVAEPPRRQPWGLHEMSVVDPDGLELVFVEVPDDHPLRRDTRSDPG
ncbi:MAG: VOC family protein [Actinomycetes bacterium]